MKRFIKWIIALPTLLVLFLYISMASFLWWNETFNENTQLDTKSVFSRSKSSHNLTLIDDGLASLAKRIELLESAQKSIELEFFIYELDSASKIITQKLIEAANRGVKVKLLVDSSAPVIKLTPLYAKILKSKNVQVKYYNTVDNYRFIKVQHRSHRKMFIIDSKFAMTGGRNIGDDYFNLSKKYNFLDSDVLIHGPIVSEMRRSFYIYWNSDFSSDPHELNSDSKKKDVIQFFSQTKKTRAILNKIKSMKEQLSASHFNTICKDLSYVTDFPGVEVSNRQVFRRISKFLLEAETEIVGETPYFILREDGMNLLKTLSSKAVAQTVLTNGLKSTDAFYTISAMTSSLNTLENETNLNLYVYNGRRPTNVNLVSKKSSKNWGIHSKRVVVDRKHIIIGTYNVDPRSANLNSEAILICRNNPALAEYMVSSINTRIKNSWLVLGKDESSLSTLLQDSSLEKKIKYLLVLPLANMFSFLL